MIRQLIITGGLIFAIAGCGEWQSVTEVDMSKTEEPKTPAVGTSGESPLTICVGSAITPKQGFADYKEMLRYIGKKMNRPIKYADKSSYAEINRLLKGGQIDVAFVCGRPYVDGHDEFGLELLVAPQMYGQVFYYSYIIVPSDSPVKNFSELRGKTFSFGDPLSNSGYTAPAYRLTRIGESADSFFKNHIFSYSHEKSIQLVAHKLVDSAAVDHLIWEYDNHYQPEDTSKTKIIEKLGPYGIPPVVVRPTLDAQTKADLRRIFLEMHQDAEGQRILKNMLIEKFALTNDGNYESIREMRRVLTTEKQQE